MNTIFDSQQASQKDRVLRRLRRGPLTCIDFAAPDVCDGGKPILRVARAIGDLKRDGHRITRKMVKTAGGAHVAQYTLVAVAVVVPLGQTWLWVATSDRGEWCGHWHTHMARAAGCARSQERFYRLRYSERQEWRISQVKVPIEAHVSGARRAA